MTTVDRMKRLPAAEDFVRSVVEGVFGQRISDAEVRRVAEKVVASTTTRVHGGRVLGTTR